MAKKSKYDTDPLDPEVADRADQQWGAPPAPSEPTLVRPQPASAQSVPQPGDPRPFANSEGPTRPLGQKNYTAYHSVFDDQSAAAAPLADSQPSLPAKKLVQPPTSRPVAGLNLAENITLILPYAPFYIGAVASVIELLMIPRSETRARFHASQGLALHIVALAIGGVLGFLSDFSGARIGGVVFSVATTILFIIAMIRTWKGEPVHVAPADDLSSWINEKISPRK
jgi:uncharacterized membrane protein